MCCVRKRWSICSRWDTFILNVDRLFVHNFSFILEFWRWGNISIEIDIIFNVGLLSPFLPTYG
jgi:hypothetical protein